MSNTEQTSEQASKNGARPISSSLQEYGRGIAGGLLFSLPLLYTQEVWKLGVTFTAWRLLAGTIAAFCLLAGYNRYAGLRRDASLSEVLIDSVEELGLGLLVASFMLWMLGQLDDASPAVMLDRVVLAGLLSAIGVSVGTAQLGSSDEDSGSGGQDERSVIDLVVLSACGAVVIAANIAPTEEIMVIAAHTHGWRLLGLMTIALLLTALICFFSDFKGSRRSDEQLGPATVLRETVITYAVALVVAAGMLWFFNRFSGQGPMTWVERTVVLGLPAALGASAGRLLFQQA